MDTFNSQISSFLNRWFAEGSASNRNIGNVERVLSGLVGVWLFRQSSRSSTWGKLPLAVLGGLALQRAVTGHSKVYGSMGVSSAEGIAGLLPASISEAPPLPLLQTVMIHKPKEEVYRRLLNVPDEALPKEEVVALHRHGNKLRLWLQEGANGMREYELELDREVEGKELAFRARASDRIHSGEIRLADIQGEETGTVVSVFLERKQSWLQNLGSAIGVDQDQKLVQKYLGYLKELVEEGHIRASRGHETLTDETVGARKETDYH